MGFTDGRYLGDPNLRSFADCPLGRTCRMVLFVLFHACDAFRARLEGSGVMLACDNFFTSPILFLCLATWGVFAVGTLRSNLRGAADAKAWMAQNSEEMTSKCRLRSRSQMLFVRMGDLAFTLWKDSKDIFFATTIHIYKKRFRGLKYT